MNALTSLSAPFRCGQGLASLILLVFVGLNHPAAQAQPEIPAYACRNGLFAQHLGHRFQLGTIKAPARAYFFNDEQGCPAGKGCQTSAYLRPGDQVILNQVLGDWACVWYPGKAHETVGWVPQKQIALSPLPQNIQSHDWVGHWSFAQVSDLNLKPAADSQALRFDGLAFWYGAVINGDRVVHVAELKDVPVQPRENHLSFSDGDESWNCKLEMTLLPPYLIVDDNLHCGGMNVTFRGVYTRTSEPFNDPGQPRVE